MKNKSAVLSALVGWLALSGAVVYANDAKSSFLLTGRTTAVMVSTGPAVLYSIVMSSFGVGTSDFLLLRDSATTNTTSALKLPPIAPTLNNGATGGILNFTPPVQFNYGLNINLSAGFSSATVVYEPGRK